MAAGDPIIDCDNKELISLFTLLSSCFGVDAGGKVYLRVEMYDQQASEGDAVTCLFAKAAGLLDQEQFEFLLRRSIVKNSEGKASIRLGTV